jgi:hypothetical protein
MNCIQIPTLLFWENGNTWYGSKGNARFFIHPVFPTQEEDAAPAGPTLEVELWPGPLTKELSQILATASFPLSEEGLRQVIAWLEEQADTLNA